MKWSEIGNNVECNFTRYANSRCNLVSLPKGRPILNKMQTPFSHPFSFSWDFLFSYALWVACEREGDRSRGQRSLSCLCCCLTGSGGRVGCPLGTGWIPGSPYGRKCSTYPKYVNYFVFFSSKLPFSLAEMTEWCLGVWVKGGSQPKCQKALGTSLKTENKIIHKCKF